MNLISMVMSFLVAACVFGLIGYGSLWLLCNRKKVQEYTNIHNGVVIVPIVVGVMVGSFIMGVVYIGYWGYLQWLLTRMQ